MYEYELIILLMPSCAKLYVLLVNLYVLLSIEKHVVQNEMCQLEMPREDETSVCLSVNSRKDSGIRSNSRRSSIQHQVCLFT